MSSYITEQRASNIAKKPKPVQLISNERLKVHRSFCEVFDSRLFHVNLDQIELSEKKMLYVICN